MDSNRLSYFLVVNETGSLRRAAELLRISPAALSKAMKLLEGEVGFSLIVPSGRGIVVTDQGKELARRAKPLLDNLLTLASGVRSHYSEHSGLSVPIKIGSFEVFTTYFLSQIAQQLPEGTSMILRELIPGAMERALVEREIDFGLTYIPIPMLGVEHHKIVDIDMAIFGTKEFLRTYQNHPFEEIPFAVPVQPISGSPTRVLGLDGWPDDQIPRLARYRVTLMESAIELARRGFAVAYLPTFVVHLHNEAVKPKFQLEMLPSPRRAGRTRQSVFIARRKSDEEGDVFKKLAKIVRVGCK